MDDFTPLSGSEKLVLRELLDKKFILGSGFLNRVEDNTAVRTWPEMTQHEKVNVPTFLRKLMNIMGMSEQWVTAWIKQKGDSRCIPWKNLKDLILAHPDVKKRVDIFALSIYGLVVFPKALGHVDEAVTDLFDWLDKRDTPIPVIFAETFRSLNAYRKILQEDDIEWRAPWLLPNDVLYQCGDFDWVPLLGIWGAVGYAPLLVLRQYRSRQFVPATQGLAECEFSYRGDGYKKKTREMAKAWNQTHRMKRLAVGLMTTPEYNEWWFKRINDNILGPSLENSQSIEEHLQLETDKLRKGKNKAEEELDNLKTDYKKLCLSMRTAGLEKTSEQWREEADTLSVKYELESDWGQELASLLKKIKVLSIRAKPYL
ncbi:hypothetical protein Goshw_025497 [Gossypium schwendimanii]|uniref:DUF7745 domain-containing protein n=1 Tax=Gossypium schwendimanii TaxID=34291 RepID=A0A7J9NE38_GOSSC|nr:hypothetical protein [Gossypium schwendimanii]